MYLKLWGEANLYELLSHVDGELAEQAKQSGCECKGPLHRANYRRKPRAVIALLPTDYEKRFSFCCGWCRQRVTPRSVRFLGRKIFLGVVVTLASVLRYGPTPRRVSVLQEALDVSPDTLRRWRRWWQQNFAQSRFWQQARARVLPPLQPNQLPHGLLARFGDKADLEQIVALLRFVSPLSSNTWRRAAGAA